MTGLPAAVLEALWVQGLLLVCYVILPAFALRLWHNADPGKWLLGIVAAMSLQSVLGWIWNTFTPGPLLLEGLLYFLIWGVVAWRYRPAQKSENKPSDRVLPLILVLSFVLRLIQPVQTYALGQSDAYSHWQFIFDVLELGRVRHVLYPSGYHWVLAMPASFLGVDSYLVARFGGAFAGALLPLAMYVLGDALGGRSAARWSAWFVGLCPAWWWLLKTGVGVFPNQFGLLLLPCVWLVYLRWNTELSASRGALLILLLAGLATASPMFLLDIMALLVAHQAVMLWRDPSAKRQRLVLFIGLALAFAAIPAAVMIFRADNVTVVESLTQLVGSTDTEEKPGVLRLLGLLFVDFLRVKRGYVSSPLFCGAGTVLAIGFLVLLVLGWRRRRSDWLLLGAWGLLAAIQTGFGVLQFTRYQRAGWQLTEAVAAGCGLYLANFVRAPSSHFRALIFSALAVCTAFSFLIYPRHYMIHSAAESDIVQFMRALSRRQAMLNGRPVRRVVDVPVLPSAESLERNRAITILCRKFTGFARGQGDPLYAALGERPGVEIHQLGKARPITFDPARQYLFVVDEAAVRSVDELGLAGRLNSILAVQPVMTRKAAERARLEAETLMANLDPAIWNISLMESTPALRIYLLKAVVSPSR